MHNVLTIREILLLILRSFDEKKRETRPNLYALSLVCKDFHELALNELWHTQLSLIPILSLLVGDAIQVKHISSPPLQEGLTEALRGAIPTRVLVSPSMILLSHGLTNFMNMAVSGETINGK